VCEIFTDREVASALSSAIESAMSEFVGIEPSGSSPPPQAAKSIVARRRVQEISFFIKSISMCFV
jgi:hypothetical protein